MCEILLLIDGLLFKNRVWVVILGIDENILFLLINDWFIELKGGLRSE